MKENFAPSLLNFFQTIVLSHLPNHELKILDIGSGNYSIFEDTDLNKNFIEALDLRVDHNKIPSSQIQYRRGNIIDSHSFKNNYYDLAFDSHCFHCLKTNEEQEIALKNIYASLKVGGIFAAEIMIQPASNKIVFPKRTIREAIELETMILNSGFKIIYFMVVNKMNFYLEVNENEITCDMLRVIAKKLS